MTVIASTGKCNKNPAHKQLSKEQEKQTDDINIVAKVYILPQLHLDGWQHT
jgi:hypothetical protein